MVEENRAEPKIWPLQIKIFAPLAALILLAHGAIYWHTTRILETESVFESIVVSLLHRNIVGSTLITIIIAFGISHFIAQSLLRNLELQRVDQDVLNDFDLESISLDLSWDEEVENKSASGALTQDRESRESIEKWLHPLAGILGQVQLAQMKCESEEVKRNLKYVELEVRKLKTQVEEILSTGSTPLNRIDNLAAEWNKIVTSGLREKITIPQISGGSIPREKNRLKAFKQAKVKIGKMLIEKYETFPDDTRTLPRLAPFSQDIPVVVRRPQLKSGIKGEA